MTAPKFDVTVIAECDSWDAEHERVIFDNLGHLRPQCRTSGDTALLRFRVSASDADGACSYIKRRLHVHATFREWRSFRVRTCSATALEDGQ